MEESGLLQGVSVNAGSQMTVEQLTAPNPATGYPGIPHNQIGVTSVGAIRAAGGDVVPTPRANNPSHATLGGITATQAGELFRPTRPNPNRNKNRGSP
jgi:hypothetical protein